MNSTDYASNALRTEKVIEKLTISKDTIWSALQLAVHSAEILDTVKKTLVYDKPLDVPALQQLIFETIRTLSDLGFELKSATNLNAGSPLDTPNLRVLHGAIGMFGEAGELCAAVKSEMEGFGLDLVNVAEETADSDWYKNIIHDETCIPEEVCRAKNIAKLKARYGDKFTNEAALNRDLAAERAVLEA